MPANRSIVSVFIPLFNGQPYVRPTIEAVLEQKLPDGYEIELLITDSGSTDGSAEIAQEYASRFPDVVKFNQIPNHEFGHGKTRQRASEVARGEFMLFLSQDATPANSEWAERMIEPFFASERVGLVYGRQLPRPTAAPILKREVAATFNQLGPSGAIVLQRTGSFVTDLIDERTNDFFSDVNSAVRRNLLVNIPFRDVSYAEDQALAQDMQRAGYIKAYAADGAVIHTNEYTAREYLHRKFDEYVGLQKSTGYLEKPSLVNLLLGWIKPTVKDWLYITRDPEYPLQTKLRYSLTAPLYAFNGCRGKFLALSHGNNSSKIHALSLESKRRHKSNS